MMTACLLRKTKSGWVSGVRLGTEKVLAWNGIPYADVSKPNRWKLPASPAPWNGVREAVSSGQLFVQRRGDKIVGEETELTLDIVRPDTKEEGLPVWFHIHGGSNMAGDTKEMDFAALCKKMNCVVVAIHYRLGFLGFLNLPALKTGDSLEDSGNFALLDIKKALEWVQENIRSFGGDPRQVLASGFSAGARNVMSMLISPIFQGLFHRAAAFSGGMGIGDRDSCEEIAAGALAHLAVEDGICNTLKEARQWLQKNGPLQKEYLFSLSGSRLVKAADFLQGQLPQLLNDGAVLPQEGFDSDVFHEVPLLLYTGKTEFSSFAVSLGKKFFQESMRNGEIFLADSAAFREFFFVCSYTNRIFALMNTREAAKKLQQGYRAPIYCCRLDWGSRPAPNERESLLFPQADHGSHRKLLGVMPEEETEKEKNEVQGLSKLKELFESYMKNFVWYGTPNRTGLPQWKDWDCVPSGFELLLDCTSTEAVVCQNPESLSIDEVIQRLKEDDSIPYRTKMEYIRTFMMNRTWSEPVERAFLNSSIWLNSRK